MNNKEFLKKELMQNKLEFSKLQYGKYKVYQKDIMFTQYNGIIDFYQLALNVSKPMFKLYTCETLLKIENGEKISNFSGNSLADFFNNGGLNNNVYRVDMFNEQVEYIFHILKNLDFNKDYSLNYALKDAISHHALNNARSILNHADFVSLMKKTTNDDCFWEPVILRRCVDDKILDMIAEKIKPYITTDTDGLISIYGIYSVYSAGKASNWLLGVDLPANYEEQINKIDYIFRKIVGNDIVNKIIDQDIITKYDQQVFVKNIKYGYEAGKYLNEEDYGRTVLSQIIKESLDKSFSSTKSKKIRV